MYTINPQSYCFMMPSFSSFFFLNLYGVCSFSWSELIFSCIQVICVVEQENGRPSIEKGQKMFTNSQSARIATVSLCLPIPSPFDYGCIWFLPSGKRNNCSLIMQKIVQLVSNAYPLEIQSSISFRCIYVHCKYSLGFVITILRI
jgi:hypothetical protein